MTFQEAIALARNTFSEVAKAPEDCFKFQFHDTSKAKPSTLIVKPDMWEKVFDRENMRGHEIIDVDLENMQ